MSEKHACLQEKDLKVLSNAVSDLRSDIRVMIRDEEEMLKKIERLKSKYDILNELATSNEIMRMTLAQVTDHNQKQDALQERRADTMEHQNETLVKINQNLNELSTGLQSLNLKVNKLETRVEAGEERNKIDLRDIQKDGAINFMKKNFVPMGIGAAVAAVIIEILKVLIV